jgi:large subunit ribosomal protein L23
MAIFDVFKKKEEEQKKQTKPIKTVKPKIEKKPVKKAVVKPAPSVVKQKKVSQAAFLTLKAPQITEKATDLLKDNQYIFKVFPGANKIEIKKAVEESYGVKVEAVRIINVPKRKRRLGKIQGWQQGYKKAIVKIKNGQKIEVLPR